MTSFNLKAYKKNPKRLRHLDGSVAIESHLTVNERYLIATWPGHADFLVHDLNFEQSLRLAPSTRKVKCRLYLAKVDGLGLWSSDWARSAEDWQQSSGFLSWHGDEWEEEIPVGDV